MARKKAPSNYGAVWTTKDFAAIRRLVKTGATGKTIAKKIGRSVVALYQKASIEGISLSAPDGTAIGRSQEGKSRRGIEETSFPLNVRCAVVSGSRTVLRGAGSGVLRRLLAVAGACRGMPIDPRTRSPMDVTVALRLPTDVLAPDLLTLARARKQFDAAAESEAHPASVLRILAHFRRILTPRPFFFDTS